MMHHYTSKKNEHYGVSFNQEYIFVQIQEAFHDEINQVRIPLTIEEARHMILLLEKAIENQKTKYNNSE